MYALRIVGITTGVIALLLSSSVAFAQNSGTGSTNQGRGDSLRAASSTAERSLSAREDAQARTEAQRAKIAQRLTDIQDKAKQQMAERLSGQFEKMNENWTNHFTKLLDRYDALVIKMEARADIAEANGKDVASTTAAIERAKTAITTARTAVSAQAEKTYLISTSTIPTTATSTTSGQARIMQSLRASFKTLHDTLFKDLFALRDGVMKDARMAVQNAIQSLGRIPGVDE